MEKKNWILEYKQFQNTQVNSILCYIKEALDSGKTTTIEITTWDDKTRDRK